MSNLNTTGRLNQALSYSPHACIDYRTSVELAERLAAEFGEKWSPNSGYVRIKMEKETGGCWATITALVQAAKASESFKEAAWIAARGWPGIRTVWYQSDGNGARKVRRCKAFANILEHASLGNGGWDKYPSYGPPVIKRMIEDYSGWNGRCNHSIGLNHGRFGAFKVTNLERLTDWVYELTVEHPEFDGRVIIADEASDITPSSTQRYSQTLADNRSELIDLAGREAVEHWAFGESAEALEIKAKSPQEWLEFYMLRLSHRLEQLQDPQQVYWVGLHLSDALGFNPTVAYWVEKTEKAS